MSGIGRASQCDVIDRYFYDNFVHYELRTRRERLYATVLRRLIPTPDIALVLVASDDTISARRPAYAREYITAVGTRYRDLPRMFPHLISVRTDGDTSVDFGSLLETLRRNGADASR
jgi:hypothetical protein